jgi:hypothetical protein
MAQLGRKSDRPIQRTPTVSSESDRQTFNQNVEARYTFRNALMGLEQLTRFWE